MSILDIVDRKKSIKDPNGIWRVKRLPNTLELANNREVWENIYDYDVTKLIAEGNDFKKNKLKDHLSYVENFYKFNKNTVYLEIGCGPAYIGDYLLKTYNCIFVGVDINYSMLITLKKLFEKNGYKKFILIHADINDLPINDNGVDYIYGGGVIEHFSNTEHILQELFRVIRKGGVSFNSVPAFNLWWISRFFNNIPSAFILKNIFEFLHINLLKNKILNKYYGYELSFSLNKLISLHKRVGFSVIKVGPFAFHPSSSKTNNNILKEIYFKISNNHITSPIYYIAATKL